MYEYSTYDVIERIEFTQGDHYLSSTRPEYLIFSLGAPRLVPPNPPPVYGAVKLPTIYHNKNPSIYLFSTSTVIIYLLL